MIFHVVGLGVIHLPWKGDVTPGQLYQVDTNFDDQVEQLGMWTMLRLDVKHMFIKPSRNVDADFSGLDSLGGGASSSSASSGGDTSQGEQEPVIDTSPNVMDVDLAQIAQSTDNSDIQWLANYFNSVTPTKKNEYTGMFEGYNVIQLVIEGFSGYAIDPQLTPTLYKLANEGFVFNNYYTALHYHQHLQRGVPDPAGPLPQKRQPHHHEAHRGAGYQLLLLPGPAAGPGGVSGQRLPRQL